MLQYVFQYKTIRLKTKLFTQYADRCMSQEPSYDPLSYVSNRNSSARASSEVSAVFTGVADPDLDPFFDKVGVGYV